MYCWNLVIVIIVVLFNFVGFILIVVVVVVLVYWIGFILIVMLR